MKTRMKLHGVQYIGAGKGQHIVPPVPIQAYNRCGGSRSGGESLPPIGNQPPAALYGRMPESLHIYCCTAPFQR
ncbi:hypothetical protein D3C75_695720 [compost metagenome]